MMVTDTSRLSSLVLEAKLRLGKTVPHLKIGPRLLFLECLQTPGRKFFMTEFIAIKEELFNTAGWTEMRRNHEFLLIKCLGLVGGI